MRFRTALNQSGKPRAQNVLAVLTKNLVGTVSFALFVLGLIKFDQWLSPPPDRCSFDFSFIAALLVFQLATATAAFFFGRNLAKRGGQSWHTAFGLGAVWGVAAQIVVTIFSVWVSNYVFQRPQEWAERCITDFFIQTLQVAVFALLGFATGKKDWRLGLACAALIYFVVWLEIWYYLILF